MNIHHNTNYNCQIWWTQPKSLPTRNECDIFKQWNIIQCLKRTAFRGNAGDPWRLSNREGSQMQQAGTQLFHFMKCLKLASLGLKGTHCLAGMGEGCWGVAANGTGFLPEWWKCENLTRHRATLPNKWRLCKNISALKMTHHPKYSNSNIFHLRLMRHGER